MTTKVLSTVALSSCTVTIAIPVDSPVITPCSTVAIASSSTLYLTVFVTFSPFRVTIILSVSPTFNINFVEESSRIGRFDSGVEVRSVVGFGAVVEF